MRMGAGAVVVALGFGALTTLSIWVHLPSQTRRPSSFARGVYAPLTHAERHLAQGKLAEALISFRVAHTRARLEGQTGISERIRLRMGGAGKALLGPSPHFAWSFFESYALLSTDFSRDAAAVEALILDATGGAEASFSYRLLRDDGCTFWGAAPELEWTGLWPLWRRIDGLSRKPVFRGIFMKSEPTWPVSAYTLLIPLYIKRGTASHPSIATLAGAPEGTTHVLYWDSNSPRYGEPTGLGNWNLNSLMETRWHFFWRVVIFCDTLPNRKGLDLKITRNYEPL